MNKEYLELTDEEIAALEPRIEADFLSFDTPESLQRHVMEQAEWLILPRAVEMVAKNISKEKEN